MDFDSAPRSALAPHTDSDRLDSPGPVRGEPAPWRERLGSGEETRGVVARAVQTLRRDGPRSLFFAVLGETVYRRLLLFERPVQKPLPRVEATLPIEFDELDEADFDAYLEFRLADRSDLAFYSRGGREPPGNLLRRRLGAGHRCVLARHDGRIVSATWRVDEVAPVSYLYGALDLGEDGVYLYDSFTRPDVRGRGLSPAVSMEIADLCRREGRRVTVSATLPENQASIRARTKVGYRVSGTIGYVGVGRWKRHFSTADPYTLRPGGPS